MDEPQAEAIVDTLHGAGTSHVATKSALDNLELRVTIKLYAVAGGVIGLVVALVKSSTSSSAKGRARVCSRASRPQRVSFVPAPGFGAWSNVCNVTRPGPPAFDNNSPSPPRNARRRSGCGAAESSARAVLLLLLLVPVGTGVARAQSPDLVADRPGQTGSATVVQRGRLQVETGYLFARDGDVDGYAVPGTLVRLGLGGRLELRLGHAGIVGGAGRSGAGNSELGAKINLLARADGWRPELALLGGLSLPTGDHGFSSDGVDPSFLVAFAHELLPRLSLGYNVGAAWESSADQPGHDAFLVYSVVLGVRLTDRLGTFLELFGDQQATGTIATSASVDGGLTWLLTDIVQVDVSVGSGLWGPTDDVFVGTGLSFRLPR